MVRINAQTPVTGEVTATIAGTVVTSVGRIDHVGTVGIIGSIVTTSTIPVSVKEPVPITVTGTLPVSVRETATVVIRDQIVYTTILASLSPSTVSGTFISPSVDALFYPGGVGFSIAYIGGESTISATVLVQNSIDNTLFRTVTTTSISPDGQIDAVFVPTRRYMRFTAINYSTLSATIDGVISLLPPGA